MVTLLSQICTVDLLNGFFLGRRAARPQPEECWSAHSRAGLALNR